MVPTAGLLITHKLTQQRGSGIQQEPHRRHMFQSAPPPPEGLHAGFPIAVASQKASQLGNPAGRFPQGGRREKNRCAPVDLGVEGLPFTRLQHDFTRHLQPLARLIGQPEQSPRRDTVGRQRPLQPSCGPHLKLFDAAAAFEHQMGALNQPAKALPWDTLCRLFKGFHRQRGQQHPAHRGRRARLSLGWASVLPGRLSLFLRQHRHQLARLAHRMQLDRIMRTGIQL